MTDVLLPRTCGRNAMTPAESADAISINEWPKPLAQSCGCKS
jgi:hypothetical protein